MVCTELLHNDFPLTLQWISSHTSLEANEIADKLAKAAADIDFDLLKSHQKREIKDYSTQEVSSHYWYIADKPGVVIDSGLSRRESP